MNGLADRLRCHLLISCHTSKSYDPKNPDMAHAGSMAWQNHTRSVTELTREKTGDDAEPPFFKLIKKNLTGYQDPIPFKWQNGLLVPDLPDLGILGTIERRKAEHVFLELLDRFTA
jgi:hypothetical protein